MTQLRSIAPDPPYYWVSKEAVRRIRRYMEERDQWHLVYSRLSVYQALCEMASNQGNSSFTVSQKALTNLCGYSTRWIQLSLGDLEAAGVITTCHPLHGGRGPKTYSLLSCDSGTLHKRCVATSQRCVDTSERYAYGGNRLPVRTLEITKEATREATREEEDSSPVNTVEVREGSSSPSSATRKKRASFVSVAGLSFADRFRATLPAKVSLVAAWRESWARVYDDLLRLDKRDQAEIERVWQWARHDEFWAPQFQSPLKLRKRNREGVTYYDVFLAKLNGDQPRRRRKDPPI